VQAFVQVKLQQHADDVVMTFQRELAKFDEVISCFAVTGTSDFLIYVTVPDLETLGATVLKRLMKIPGVRDVHSSIVLETMKRSAPLPLSHLPAKEELGGPILDCSPMPVAYERAHLNRGPHERAGTDNA
jgi:Lrp/AsnC family leucine-responsive transcriptional regulator